MSQMNGLGAFRPARRRVLKGAGLLTLASITPARSAQAAFPSRTVRIVVPWAPGGLVDTGGRVIAEGLSQALSQAAVVENVPGAAGTLGASQVAKAVPDGHTLLMATSSIAIDIAGRRKMAYDPVRDLTPVATVSDSFSVVVVPASSPWMRLTDLLATARAEPGKLSFGTPGIGSPAHLFTELLAQTARIQLLHVPYGRSPAINDLLGGQLSMMVATIPVSIPHIRSGRLRALAVTSSKRLANLPDVPTAQEAGLTGYEAGQWLGLFAPAGTPASVVERLSDVVQRTVVLPASEKAMAPRGLEPRRGGPEQLKAALRNDIELWRRVMDAAQIRLDK